jgi:hypothetical protein
MSHQDQYTNEHKIKLIAALMGDEKNMQYQTLAGLILRLAQDRPAVRWAVVRMLNNMLDALDELDAASGKDNTDA